MLAVSNGQHILMSTPFGKRGHFYEVWENGGDSWDRILVTADQCPRISADFLAGEKRDMPTLWFSAEYECTFCDTLDAVFLTEDIEAAISDTVQPLFLEAQWQQ
jgi:hypothetical protein